MKVTKGEAALLAVPVAGCVFGLWALWEFVHILMTWLIMTAFVLLGAGGITAGSLALSRRGARRTGQREIDHARYAALSHLTEADERWLATHFWVIPVETLRIRGGMPWNETWTWSARNGDPLPVTNHTRMKTRAEYHRQVAWGENVPVPKEIADETGMPAIEGEIMGEVVKPRNTTGIYTEEARRSRCKHASVTRLGQGGWSVCLACGTKFKYDNPFSR